MHSDPKVAGERRTGSDAESAFLDGGQRVCVTQVGQENLGACHAAWVPSRVIVDVEAERPEGCCRRWLWLLLASTKATGEWRIGFLMPNPAFLLETWARSHGHLDCPSLEFAEPEVWGTEGGVQKCEACVVSSPPSHPDLQRVDVREQGSSSPFQKPVRKSGVGSWETQTILLSWLGPPCPLGSGWLHRRDLLRCPWTPKAKSRSCGGFGRMDVLGKGLGSDVLALCRVQFSGPLPSGRLLEAHKEGLSSRVGAAYHSVVEEGSWQVQGAADGLCLRSSF